MFFQSRADVSRRDRSAASGGAARRRPSRSRQATEWIDASATLESLDGAVIGRGLDGAINTWNAGATSSYGYSSEEIVGQQFDLIVPDARRGSESEIARTAVTARLSDRYESERLCKDGTIKAVSVRIAPITDPAGGVVVGISTSEQEIGVDRREQWTPGAGTYLRRAFDDAPIGIALVSVNPESEGCLLRVNRAFCELTGYPREHLEGTNVRALVHPEDTATDLAAMGQLKAAKIADVQLEQRLLHAERHAVWVSVSASLVLDAEDRPLYCIRQLLDIEERKRHEDELGYLVEHDPLTGLLNRRGFIRELTHELAYARRYGGGGAVLLLDVDDFKYVNDTLGHAAGDQVLSEVARIVLKRLRETDVFARLGGDEFAVLLPRTTMSDAQILSTLLLEAVRAECGLSLADGRRISLSIGVNDFEAPGEDSTAEDIVVDADDAMYLAKQAGKDRVAIAAAGTHEHTTARVTWAERLRRAVQEGLFELHCQPIVDLADDTTTQWELLLRLPGEDGELILPSQFLYTAERSGLVLEIDRWVVSEAFRLLAEQSSIGNDLRLEVNISGRSVGDSELLTLIERELANTAIGPASLIFELTETAAIANIDRARGFASRLQSLGCGFALDDFGAGFGSFYYLKHLPFDYVKIDGEFVRNLPTSSTDQLILDSIVQMSKGLGKHTIAEFVGDRETVEVLKRHGVDYGQGFFLGKPVPVSAALAT